MVDRAQGKTVANFGCAGRLGVADDVRRVKQPNLLEPADRALLAVRGKDDPAEAPLVQPDLHFARGVASFDRVRDRDRFELIDRTILRPTVTRTRRSAG